MHHICTNLFYFPTKEKLQSSLENYTTISHPLLREKKIIDIFATAFAGRTRSFWGLSMNIHLVLTAHDWEFALENYQDAHELFSKVLTDIAKNILFPNSYKLMKIAVIIINWNGKTDTLQCLNSLSKESYPKKDIIIVDNGSIDDSVNAIKILYPKIIIVSQSKNIGFAAGNNKGIQKALELDCDAIILLNNDTVIEENCISSFIHTSTVYPNAILGAKIYQMHNPLYLDHLGGNWNSSTGNFDLVGKDELGETNYLVPITMDYACGCAMFIPSFIIKEVGMFYEDYFLYWEDSDFCFRAKQLGYPTHLCPSAKVWHIGSSSMNTHSIQTIYFWWRNRLLWIDKNLKYSEKRKLWKKRIYREILRTYKLYILHWIQWKIFRQYQTNNSSYAKRLRRLLHYSAACRGIYHYIMGKF